MGCGPPWAGPTVYFFVLVFIYFWLHWVLVVARGVFIAAHGLLSSCGVWTPEHMGLAALWHVGSQFPNQGSNPRPLHWKADS